MVVDFKLMAYRRLMMSNKSDLEEFIELWNKNIVSPGAEERILGRFNLPEIDSYGGIWYDDDKYDHDDEYYKKYGRYKEKEKKCECGLDAVGGGGKHAHYCPKYKEEE